MLLLFLLINFYYINYIKLLIFSHSAKEQITATPLLIQI